MAITLKLPVVVDASVLRHAYEAAAKTGSPLRIETYYRVLDGPDREYGCDTETELQQMAAVIADRLNPQKTPDPRSADYRNGYNAGYHAGARSPVVREDARTTDTVDARSPAPGNVDGGDREKDVSSS